MINTKFVEGILDFSNMKKGGAKRGGSVLYAPMNKRSDHKKGENSVISTLGSRIWKGGHRGCIKRGCERGSSVPEYWFWSYITCYEALKPISEVKFVFFHIVTRPFQIYTPAPPLPPLFWNFHFSNIYCLRFYQNQKSSLYDDCLLKYVTESSKN